MPNTRQFGNENSSYRSQLWDYSFEEWLKSLQGVENRKTCEISSFLYSLCWNSYQKSFSLQTFLNEKFQTFPKVWKQAKSSPYSSLKNEFILDMKCCWLSLEKWKEPTFISFYSSYHFQTSAGNLWVESLFQKVGSSSCPENITNENELNRTPSDDSLE